jgi:hypothetical protein
MAMVSDAALARERKKKTSKREMRERIFIRNFACMPV